MFSSKAKNYVKHEDGTLEFKDVRIRRIRPIRVPKPGSKVGKLRSKLFPPKPAFEKRHWREDARPEKD